MNLSSFATDNLFEAASSLFSQLGIKVNSTTSTPIPISTIIKDQTTTLGVLSKVEEAYFLGIVDDGSLNDNLFARKVSFKEAEHEITDKYKGIMLFALDLDDPNPTRSELADLIRAFNKASKSLPVTLVVKYKTKLAFLTCERNAYKQTWRSGEKAGKIVLLKGIDLNQPVAAHLKILNDLSISRQPHIKTFDDLYKYWRSVFSIQTLNDEFYADLQKWFYWATKEIKLPFCHPYTSKEENIKNFLVRLLARTMFCWFVKEKGLIRKELLELVDWEGKRFPLTKDVAETDFLKSNSYYRGVLQNIFFRALNQSDKKSKKDFEGTRYLHPEFAYDWFVSIPYLNGGIFDELLEDNGEDLNEDSVIKIPNFLFYGITKQESITVGKAIEKLIVHHKGLNEIFQQYKFTLEENTSFEEDIALDPELLGLVFENLLAELDPNLEESTILSIRKLTGSYYTPRKIIQEMVDESLFLYILNYVQTNHESIKNARKQIADLIYHRAAIEDQNLREAIVAALDKFRVLDPACGSGAFPMGVLHRMVDLLKLVDADNNLWLGMKLRNVDPAQRGEFKKVLTNHLDDYSRKLGIIRDSIYGIDIQPLAVQITKLRFFISLLIDQNTEKGITPMPNIETKIVCADTLKDIQPDLFSYDAIERLKAERIAYYRPDLTHDERNEVAENIADILDGAFPSFAREVTGKNIEGQNRILLREWFTHASIAAPFFNMDFFYPELSDLGGFDCVIGNPPYGGTNIPDTVKTSLGLESTDPYGAFVARFLNRSDQMTPLKHNGVLAMIVSDTFMTIKSHLPLRQKLIQNRVWKMIRVHPDTFRAVVSTAIIICQRNTGPQISDGHVCQMADLTNLSIHSDHDRFLDVLDQTRGLDFVDSKSISTAHHAVFYYRQAIIAESPNVPFFVAKPALFELIRESGEGVSFKTLSVRGRSVRTRIPVLNGVEIPLTKLSEIAVNVGGVKTYDNKRFVRSAEGRGRYSQIKTHEIAVELSEREKVDGIPNGKAGKFVPFDKSGDMITQDGRIINYWKPNEFYLDWSKSAVDAYSQNNGLRNRQWYFQTGITYSVTGVYAPTFRLSTGFVFGQKGATIFTEVFNIPELLGILCSRSLRYLVKNFLSHGVDATDSLIGEIPIPMDARLRDKVGKLVSTVLRKLEDDPNYDYASHEQLEIDHLVYKAFGMSAEDINEIELWFFRRYPKVAAAQAKNLRDLGKSRDYLELYGLK